VICGQADWLIYRDARGTVRKLATPGVLLSSRDRRGLYVVRPTRAQWSRAHGSTRARAMYTRWHREQPDRAALLRARLTRRRRLGRVLQIGYTYFGRGKRSGEPRYHPFPAPPVLHDLGGGNYAIRGGRFVVTYRGIVG
jgi:hypothetical protein